LPWTACRAGRAARSIFKLVVLEKGTAFQKIKNEGGFLDSNERDNANAFYGVGRQVNQVRWLQQAWWRYLQARWGYSPNIHSWELTNEGDPANGNHFALADEFGRFMHCRVFGIDVAPKDGARCDYQHPNAHYDHLLLHLSGQTNLGQSQFP
jgi:hypothetical protein